MTSVKARSATVTTLFNHLLLPIGHQVLPPNHVLGRLGTIMPGLTSTSTSVETSPQVITATKLPTLRTRHGLSAVWMRAGTSKGLFLHRHHLPRNISDWTPMIIHAMGNDQRQLDGLGGATSTTSKCAVISPSKRPDADVDYTFIQVPIGGSKLDMSGNCGNIASGVGPFAVDEGLVSVDPGENQATVRVFNTNTQTLMVERFAVNEDGRVIEDGETEIPGLSEKGSGVTINFVKPQGAMTGKLLPNDESVTSLRDGIMASLVDAANPFVLINGKTLPSWYWETPADSQESLLFIESLRREGAVKMGLADSEVEAAKTRGTPKIAVLMPSEDEKIDLQVRSYSMGKPHSSLQLTGAVCIGVAADTPGTIAYQIVSKRQSQGSRLMIRHPGGDMPISVVNGNNNEVESVAVTRTARRLMEGTVYYLS